MSGNWGLRKETKGYSKLSTGYLLSEVRVTVTFMDEGERHGENEENGKDLEELS